MAVIERCDGCGAEGVPSPPPLVTVSANPPPRLCLFCHETSVGYSLALSKFYEPTGRELARMVLQTANILLRELSREKP